MADPRRTEIIVLGAGIAGLALAHHLARRNLRTSVIDPGPRIGGATGRAAGIVTEQLWNTWDIEVTRDAHAEARAMLERSEPRTYWRNGFLRFTRNPELSAPLQAASTKLREAGVASKLLDGAAMGAMLPGARFPAEATGLYSESDGCVTPSALAEAYAASARSSGAELLDGSGLASATADGNEWVVTTATGSVRAPRLVVAAGAWSKRILAELGHPLPLCPYRMQAALLRPETVPGESFPSVHDIDTDVYVRPELGGRILAGDGTESTESDPDRFVRGGDASFLEHLAGSLEGPFPSWAGGEVVSAWAGVCTATRDRRPLVGPVPEAPGLFVMTGFNGFGVMRSGGVAARLAEALRSASTSSAAWDPLAPVLPDRFGPGGLAFRPRPGFTLEDGDVPRF